MNHDATHCKDFCADCPMYCYRAELEVDLRSRWKDFVGVPLSYAHMYGTEECKRDAYHKESMKGEDCDTNSYMVGDIDNMDVRTGQSNKSFE